jgi:hypothetical protein
MIVEAKKIAPLNLRQIRFLIAWFDILDGFGFKGVDEKEQLHTAIRFYLRMEREWQNKVLFDNLTTSLSLYIENHGIEEGISFPQEFSQLIEQRQKEWEGI